MPCTRNEYRIKNIPGQKYTPTSSGSAGIRALPSCKRHEILPVSLTAKFAQVPKKIPNAVHICHVMTKAPRIEAGEFSALKIGMVAPLQPMPRPSSKRVMKSWGQVCETAEPMGARVQKIAETKMVPRRPKCAFKGSESQHPLEKTMSAYRTVHVCRRATHRKAHAR